MTTFEHRGPMIWALVQGPNGRRTHLSGIAHRQAERYLQDGEMPTLWCGRTPLRDHHIIPWVRDPIGDLDMCSACHQTWEHHFGLFALR